MIQETNNYNYELLRQLSVKLNVSYETQDWGIINADGKRTKEFIDFFYEHSEVHSTLRYELFELIIASFNEVILEGINESKLDKSFVDFISTNKNVALFQPILNYWLRISDEEFPVGRWIFQIMYE